MKDFTHLHVHSEYSLLDGYASTSAIANRAAELEMDSIALTDHGVMYGVIEFIEAAKKAGIRPIVGVEAYMATGKHNERSGSYYHQLLLARNATGYRNLVRLTTRAHLDGFYRKPRIDRALLEEHCEGLIATSSCLAGEVPQALHSGDKQKAREIAAWYRDRFGEHYYLELQLHNNTPQLEPINEELVRIGQELGIPLVATNDTHFVRREDIDMHNHILAMGYGTTVAELCSKNRQMDETYHIMSGEEMWQRFKRYGTTPLENTRRIADSCTLDLDFGQVQLPAFEIPPGHNAASYLRHVCLEGLNRRFADNPPAHYLERLDNELDVINATGFPDYMLIVWDYVKFARSKGIPCLPRGSAGASLVLYCLEITQVDPVENKLLFERFLSRERLEMPDIDTDFADSRRHEVIEYIAQKYGRENTAQIITYGTLGAKAALRDIGRVLAVDPKKVNDVASKIPALPVGMTIKKALDKVPELRQFYESDEQLRDMIERAQSVEGRMRNVGTHACGLVVSRNPLADMVPLQRTTKDENALMAAYEGPTLAKIGLLKMDILGLTNLSVVANALDYIADTTGLRMDLVKIPTDDAKTFASLSRGETVSVFQFESAGMTRYLKELKPSRVQDLYAMVALYRPGPLEQIPNYIRNKHNPDQITYLHPILQPILEDTYGVIVYQEQIMQLLQAIAGYTLGRSYVVLKAIGKKKRDLMAQEEPRFKEGCLQNGLTQEQADQLWDLIQPFAGYSFNRPHSTLYGLLSYQTAYLKVNYPAQYMAAVLDAAAGSVEEVAKCVNECARLGVEVLPVDINYSNEGFSFQRLHPDQIEEGKQEYAIRFGLSAIKNVGSGPVQSILQARDQDGPFTSLEDFCTRVDRHALNKRVVEALIKSGALDTLPGTRHQLLAILDQALTAGIEAQKMREMGQASLFDLFGDGGSSGSGQASSDVRAIPLPSITKTEREQKKEELAWEKELLGMYVSNHPVVEALQGADTSGTISIGEATEHVGKTQSFIGMVTGVRRIATKKGDSMLVATLEDEENSIEMVVFPKVLAQCKDLLQDDAVLRITAKVDNRRDTLQLVVEGCEPVTYRAEAPTEREPDPADALADPDALTDPDAEDLPEAAATNTSEPAPAAPAPEPQPAPAAPAAPATTTNGQHAEPVPRGPDPTPTPEPAQPKPTIPTLDGPAQGIRSRTKVTGVRKSESSNGNGHSRKNGNGAQSTANGSHQEHGSPSNGPVRNLRISLPRTGDLVEDTRCMQDIHELLYANQGDDLVTLYLQSDDGTVVLRPHYRVCAAPALVTDLRALLGEASVDVGVE